MQDSPVKMDVHQNIQDKEHLPVFYKLTNSNIRGVRKLKELLNIPLTDGDINPIPLPNPLHN